MASIPYREIVGSSHFKFLVGPEKKEFSIHSALVAVQSKALNVLVNGAMKEAIEKCVTWQELDEETFLRFSQFVYTGSYDKAEPRKREPQEREPWKRKAQEYAPIPEPPCYERRKTSSARLPTIRMELLWNCFRCPHQKKVARINNSPDDDYTEVFLSHAQMYVFADYYDIVALRSLALRSLRQALVRYRLYEEGSHDIISLVKYCFSNTVEKGGWSDPLRSLVCNYVACNVEDLLQHKAFRELLDTSSEFARCLAGPLGYRLAQV